MVMPDDVIRGKCLCEDVAEIREALKRIGTGDFHFGKGLVLHVEEAEQWMRKFLQLMFGDSYVWLPQYDFIAKWLKDNKGRGLMLMGNCGVGKTVMCCYVIPGIMKHASTS